LSASILLTTISRSRPRRAAHCRKRPVIISMPFCALMTIAAVSTAASAGSEWPRKSAYPGVSSRWTTVGVSPFGASKLATASLSECCSCFSSGV